jgi:uncharacterized protein
MPVNIKVYQDACDIALNKLKNNEQVIAIVVYGSIISGDIWEKSDIDFLVIAKEENKMETVHCKILDVPMHINYISKNTFIDSYNSMLKGGTFHKAFFMGKLVYCIDKAVEEIYNSTRFYSDRDKSIRNIEILCNLLKSMHYAKKYMVTGKHETAFQWSVEVLKNYARILMNSNGHITDNDILSFAVNMNTNVENVFVTLNDDKPLLGRLNYIVDATEKFILVNVEMISQPIIQYLRQIRKPCSSADIHSSEEFKQINADINILLEILSSMGLIKEKSRKYMTGNNEYLIDEIVYCVS